MSVEYAAMAKGHKTPLDELEAFVYAGQRGQAAVDRLILDHAHADARDVLRPDDEQRLRAIEAAAGTPASVDLLHAYYADLDRANRTPRSLLYLHLGLLVGLLRQRKP